MVGKAKSWIYDNRVALFMVALGLSQMIEVYTRPAGILFIACGGYHLLRGEK